MTGEGRGCMTLFTFHARGRMSLGCTFLFLRPPVPSFSFLFCVVTCTVVPKQNPATGCRPPLPLHLRVAKAGQKSFERGNYPLLPTGVGERYSQLISNLGHAALLRRCELPLQAKGLNYCNLGDFQLIHYSGMSACPWLPVSPLPKFLFPYVLRVKFSKLSLVSVPVRLSRVLT